MERLRQPLQGVKNIIRFNWHFYLLSLGLILVISLLNIFFNGSYLIYGKILCSLIIVTTIISILISFYIYDLSDLYKLQWIDSVAIATKGQIINIHSGFDETSVLLKEKFPEAKLTVLDFYDPLKHTEVSIKRARKAYPPFENTISVSTRDLALNDNSADNIFVIFAAHEIRDENERVSFFGQLKKTLKPDGSIVVIEHLRDLPNFGVYNIGAFHFITKSSWFRVFKEANLVLHDQFKFTPFISIFILKKNGIKY